jgi:hypothetical protein
MKITQSTRHFEMDNGDLVTLRVISPSKPRGGWIGNKEDIREWKIFRRSTAEKIAYYVTPTQSEIIELEKVLGEIHTFAFKVHPFIGIYTTPVIP